MATSNTYRTDLYALHNYIQNTFWVHPKEVFIESLRNFFRQDSYYHFVADEWGFPKTNSQAGLELDAGIEDEENTRIFIGDRFRYDVIFYPSLLIKATGNSFVPVSFNNNRGVVFNEVTRFVDGYGNESFTTTPSYLQHSGAWEGSIDIEVWARSHRTLDELAGLVSLHFIDHRRQELTNQGVFVKGTSTSSPTETDDRGHKLYTATVTCDIRTEWERRIPVATTIDAINICMEFGTLHDDKPDQLAPNLKVSTEVDLIDSLSD